MMKTEVEQGGTASDSHCLSVNTSEWTHEDTRGEEFTSQPSNRHLGTSGGERMMHGALSSALQEGTV